MWLFPNEPPHVLLCSLHRTSVDPMPVQRQTRTPRAHQSDSVCGVPMWNLIGIVQNRPEVQFSRKDRLPYGSCCAEVGRQGHPPNFVRPSIEEEHKFGGWICQRWVPSWAAGAWRRRTKNTNAATTKHQCLHSKTPMPRPQKHQCLRPKTPMPRPQKHQLM